MVFAEQVVYSLHIQKIEIVIWWEGSMHYIRLSALIGFAVAIGNLLPVKADAADPLVFSYSYYLDTGNGDFSERSVVLDHTYYASRNTHSDSIGFLQVYWTSKYNQPLNDDCYVDAPLYITSVGGASYLSTLVTIYTHTKCGNGPGQRSVWYPFEAIDIVRPLATWTSYVFGGDIRSDDDAEAYLDFLCAYGSNWAEDGGLYKFEVRAGAVDLSVYNGGNYVTSGRFRTFTKYPTISVYLHCYLK
jgi:hypothetical protein